MTLASPLPALTFSVTNAADKVVYRGKTDEGGAFTTPALAPGNYVVTFHAKSASKGGPFALVVGEGQKEVVANSVPGGKFVQGGVAMRVEVEKGMPLKGQVSRVGTKVAGGSTAATPIPPNGERKENGRRVKYVDGRKFVWVENDISAGASGHWAPADSMEARNSSKQSRTREENAPSHPSDH